MLFQKCLDSSLITVLTVPFWCVFDRAVRATRTSARERHLALVRPLKRPSKRPALTLRHGCRPRPVSAAEARRPKRRLALRAASQTVKQRRPEQQ